MVLRRTEKKNNIPKYILEYWPNDKKKPNTKQYDDDDEEAKKKNQVLVITIRPGPYSSFVRSRFPMLLILIVFPWNGIQNFIPLYLICLFYVFCQAIKAIPGPEEK